MTYQRKTPQTKKLETRLATQDLKRFEQLVVSTGKSRPQLLREAMLEYMDRQEQGVIDERESRLEKRLKAIEDRYASLLVRVGLDVGTTLALLSSRIDPKQRRQLLDNCYKTSVQHFNKKLEGAARDLKQRTKET